MLTTHLATARLTELLDRAMTDLEATRRLLSAAVARLDDSEPGYPGGGSGGATGDDSGPLRSTVVLRDDALRDRALLEQRLKALETNSRMVLRVVQKWGIRTYGNGEGVDERSIVCDWCGDLKEVKSRRICNWCSAVLGDINKRRGDIGLKPVNRIPQAAIEHRRNGRSKSVRPSDLDRWARNTRR